MISKHLGSCLKSGLLGGFFFVFFLKPKPQAPPFIKYFLDIDTHLGAKQTLTII